MISFGGDNALKARLQANIDRHLKADTLVKGMTGQDGKGCSVWCSAGYYDHARAAEEYLLPEWLWRLNDTLFEGMTASDALQFPAQLWAAIPVGVDLEPVQWRLAIARHKRQLEHRAEWAEPYVSRVVNCLNMTIKYFELLLSGADAAEAAQSAAWSAAQSAAWSARAAARAAAWSAGAYYEWEAGTLLRLLKEEASRAF